jgi:hypothetical protein
MLLAKQMRQMFFVMEVSPTYTDHCCTMIQHPFWKLGTQYVPVVLSSASSWLALLHV